jgi:hypothetical protein
MGGIADAARRRCCWVASATQPLWTAPLTFSSNSPAAVSIAGRSRGELLGRAPVPGCWRLLCGHFRAQQCGGVHCAGQASERLQRVLAAGAHHCPLSHSSSGDTAYLASSTGETAVAGDARAVPHGGRRQSDAHCVRQQRGRAGCLWRRQHCPGRQAPAAREDSPPSSRAPRCPSPPPPQRHWLACAVCAQWFAQRACRHAGAGHKRRRLALRGQRAGPLLSQPPGCEKSAAAGKISICTMHTRIHLILWGPQTYSHRLHWASL